MIQSRVSFRTLIILNCALGGLVRQAYQLRNRITYHLSSKKDNSVSMSVTQDNEIALIRLIFLCRGQLSHTCSRNFTHRENMLSEILYQCSL
jgi:hypothetical protein